MLEIILIAAVAKNKVIGKEGKLPWQDVDEIRRPDMQRFRNLTINHPVIMGRKTYESIPRNFRPLKDRTNIVLTRGTFKERGITICQTLDQALEIARQLDNKVYVAGGQSVYEGALPYATRMEITEININFDGDAFFPRINKGQWTKTKIEPNQSKGGGYSFVTYERNNP